MWTLLISVVFLITLLFLGLLSNLTIIMNTFFVIFAIQKLDNKIETKVKIPRTIEVTLIIIFTLTGTAIITYHYFL